MSISEFHDALPRSVISKAYASKSDSKGRVVTPFRSVPVSVTIVSDSGRTFAIVEFKKGGDSNE